MNVFKTFLPSCKNIEKKLSDPLVIKYMNVFKYRTEIMKDKLLIVISMFSNTIQNNTRKNYQSFSHKTYEHFKNIV